MIKSIIFTTLIFSYFFYVDGLSASEQLDCNKAISTIDVNKCLDNNFNAADKKLNSIYSDLMTQLNFVEQEVNIPNNTLIKSLKHAQRKWIKYRDDNCEFHSNLAYGGTGMSTYYINCKYKMTTERANELEKILNDYESRGF